MVLRCVSRDFQLQIDGEVAQLEKYQDSTTVLN